MKNEVLKDYARYLLNKYNYQGVALLVPDNKIVDLAVNSENF